MRLVLDVKPCERYSLSHYGLLRGTLWAMPGGPILEPAITTHSGDDHTATYDIPEGVTQVAVNLGRIHDISEFQVQHLDSSAEDQAARNSDPVSEAYHQEGWGE